MFTGNQPSSVKVTQFVYAFILILASIRGVAVYHLGFPANITYQITAFLLVFIGLTSLWNLLLKESESRLNLLKNVILLNFIFFIFFIGSGIFITIFSGVRGGSLVSWAYYFSVFPLIFSLLYFNKFILQAIIFCITAFTIFGVYYFFSLGLSGGFDAIYEAHSILRPGEFRYSRTASFLLPFGYTGSHHDTANILVMCSIFFLASFFICQGLVRRILYLLLYIIVFFMAMLTGSAANFLVILVVSAGCFLVYLTKSLRSILIASTTVVSGFLVFWLITPGSDAQTLIELTYVFDKFDPDNMDDDLWAALDVESIKLSVASVLVGFGGYTDAPLVLSEIGYLSLLSRLGFVPLALLLFIGLSPIYYLLVLQINQRRYEQFLVDSGNANLGDVRMQFRQDSFRALMMAMPVFSGIFTLIHYGSLFRITSIALFCVVLALFFKEYLYAHDRICQPKR